jgi:hypothetical protein
VGDEPTVFICNTDEDDDGLMPWERDDWTHADSRAMFDRLSDHIGEWQGVPVPLDEDDMPLRLHEKHPLREIFNAAPRIEILVGGPDDDERFEALSDAVGHAFSRDERIVNRWYDASHNRDVIIFKRGDGTAFALAPPRAPNSSMDRLELWVRTMIASDAWDVEAEMKAMGKLGELLNPRQRRSYLLTGSFMETSEKSGLSYIFRRLRPTIVLTPREKWWGKQTGNMRCLAVLCMHPIGYYDKTWAGCMVPTDDVIAHLLTCRGDEAYFWRKANQHDPASPEAGL